MCQAANARRYYFRVIKTLWKAEWAYSRNKNLTELDTVRVTAWQQRRLIFDEETLANIAFEFNRYNRRPFHIEDSDAGRRRFSGIFDVDDPESLAQLLSHESGLVIERGEDEIAIQTR